MGYAEIEKDLQYIKNTMEISTKYTNIPAVGYIIAGLLGLLGALATYNLPGISDYVSEHQLKVLDIITLAVLWSGIFIISLVCVIILSILRARKHKISAWNSLAARMFLSQVPLAAAIVILTVCALYRNSIEMIPAIWLLGYGVISYSFSYYTGNDHKVQGIIFLLLGLLASFSGIIESALLLGAGFGGVHIIFGIIRIIKNRS